MSDHRYNSPPTWPTPPQGWAPPEGWQPDPAWGPAPDGWQFWVPADGSTGAATTGRPNSRSAWGRTAIVALISLVIVAIFPIVGGADNLAELIGAFVGRALVVYLITAGWAFFSRRRWGWARYTFTYLGILVLVSAVSVAGNG